MKQRAAVIFGFVVIIVAFSLLARLIFDGDDNDKGSVGPLVMTAATFSPPVGSTSNMADTSTDDPATAVRGWKSDGNIDEACTKWRDAFRTWMGDAELGSVQGEVVPGQSCSLVGRKDGYNARLLVAVYNAQPPQATLTVTQ